MGREEDFDKIQIIYEAHDFDSIDLTDWEIDFLQSLEKQLKEGKSLSWKQVKILNKIKECVK